jgi:hypothetical protein
MRVALITTGQMEFLGLPAMLTALFPGHQFFAEPALPNKPYHGFTSATVRPLQPDDPLGNAAKLLVAALGTLVPETTGAAANADLAVILEDVELCNKGQEAVVTEHMKESARRWLDSRSDVDRAHLGELLQHKVSFHLAAPMPESWFFGDLAALATEVPADHLPPRLMNGRDLENFLTDDAAYDADVAASGAAGVAGRPNRRRPWACMRPQEHPKAYLAWLLRDTRLADGTSYKESQEGVRLLKRLDWGAVLSNPSWFGYARALIRDLESALGVPARGAPAGGVEAPLTSVHTRADAHVLRNL